MVQKHKVTSIIPRLEKDNFRNFNGFAPEGKYESFSRNGTTETAKDVLRGHIGKTVYIEYNPVGEFGVTEKFIDGLFLDSKAIDALFKNTNTDHIIVGFHEETDGYIFQRIVDRDQSVTQIERTWF